MNRIAIASLVLLAGTSAASAQFSLYQPIVSRTGNGTETLINTGNDVFLDQYNAGVAAQASPGYTVALPVATTTASGFTLSGAATSEGQLSMSGGASPSIVIAGYSLRSTSGSLANSTSAAVPRTVGFTSMSGTVTMGAGLTNDHSGNNIRGAASSDGSQYWTSGGNEGIRWASNTLDTTSDVVSATVTNTRNLNIFDNQLYFSTGSGSSRGVYAVGTGLPNSGPTTATNVINMGGSASPYDFLMLDLNPNVAGLDTMYVADDRASAAGGIYRFDFNVTVWTQAYILGTGAANVGARGLAGYVDPTGAVILFATTGESTGANRLIQITDTGAASPALTLATSGTNQAFRGVEIFVPTPGAAALVGMGTLMIGRRRRR